MVYSSKSKGLYGCNCLSLRVRLITAKPPPKSIQSKLSLYFVRIISASLAIFFTIAANLEMSLVFVPIWQCRPANWIFGICCILLMMVNISSLFCSPVKVNPNLDQFCGVLLCATLKPIFAVIFSSFAIFAIRSISSKWSQFIIVFKRSALIKLASFLYGLLKIIPLSQSCSFCISSNSSLETTSETKPTL